MVGKRRRSCPSILKCPPICTVLVLFFIWVPFIVCDLYFAYTDYYCTEQFIMNTKIVFTMAVWMQVRAYTNLGFLIILFILAVIAIFKKKSLWPVKAFTAFLIIALLFQLAWLIVGAVMFWGYLWPASICVDSVNTYLWASLIILMLAWLFLLAMTLVPCFFKKKAHQEVMDVELTGADTWTGPPIQYPTSQLPTSQDIVYPRISDMPSGLNYDMHVQQPASQGLSTGSKFVEYNAVNVRTNIDPVVSPYR